MVPKRESGSFITLGETAISGFCYRRCSIFGSRALQVFRKEGFELAESPEFEDTDPSFGHMEHPGDFAMREVGYIG
jgi:hypothetical protein